MFISTTVGWQIILPIVICVIVQVPLALFCLYRLARLNIPIWEYLLWNVLIIIVFFIGDAIFLVYYAKVKDKKAVESETAPGVKESEEATETEETKEGEKDTSEADEKDAPNNETSESEQEASDERAD